MTGRRRQPGVFVGANTPLLLAAILLFGCIFGGCGIKGPPVPPLQPPLPAVQDLTYQVTGQTVTLFWKLPAPLTGKPASRASFVILRSRSTLDQPACETCPLVFERMGTLAYADTDQAGFSRVLPLDPGFRYVFKVHLEMNRATGLDSNPVKFDFAPDELPAATETP